MRIMMRKTLTLVAAIGACILVAYLFIGQDTPVDAEEEHEHNHDFVAVTLEQCAEHGITTRKASSGTLQQVVRAPAKILIAPDQIAHVLPKVSGIVQSAYKHLGEHVAQGELLATLESKEMAEAKSAYLTALRKEQLAIQSFDREQSLFDKQITSAQDYQTVFNAKEEASIEKELTRQKLYALGLSMGEVNHLPHDSPDQLLLYELRSPIAGQVIDRHLLPGELVSTDHQAFIIANLNTVWAEISVFPKDRQYVKTAQSVAVTSHEGLSAMGIVTYLSPVINEETHTSTAIAEVNNSSGDWFPGSFAQAELVTEEIPVDNFVPRTAVQEVEGENVVFVVEKNGFAVRPITVGRSDEQCYEVLDGVNPDDVYAADNTFLLKAELQKDEAEHMD